MLGSSKMASMLERIEVRFEMTEMNGWKNKVSLYY